MAATSVPLASADPPPQVLHVLHVASAEAFARFGRMFRQLGLALGEEGVRLALLTDDSDAVAELDGTPLRAQLFRPLSGWGAWRLRRYLPRQFDPPPDVVHVWGTTCLGCLSDWTLRRRVALLIYLTALRDVERLTSRGLRSNEHPLAGCPEFGQLLAERWPELAPALTVVEPGLLLPAQAPALALRGRTLGLLWTGTIDENSGLDVLVQAVAQLRVRQCDLQLGLVGVGPATGRVWRHVQRECVQDCVSLIAEPKLWDRAMSGVDVCVVPACQRDLTLAPLLAMGLGRVVIASRDQLADWFIEDQTCLQFAPGSAAELAQQVLRAAAAHPHVLAVARAAAQYVRQHHTITRLAAQLAHKYRQLSGRQPVATVEPEPRDVR